MNLVVIDCNGSSRSNGGRRGEVDGTNNNYSRNRRHRRNNLNHKGKL